MRLLLISNSTNPGEPYLDYPKNKIKEFLGDKPVKAVFIPYAAVTFSFDDYEEKVSERFREIGHDIVSIHHFKDPVAALKDAPAIIVGGGNTWKLLKMIRDNNLIDIVRQKVLGGIPYIGWSAGSNVACPTLKTTNDMPVVEPDSFFAFNLIPFQINPHYLDANPAGHAGETREQRIEEFIEANPGIYVAGLREGTLLLLENGRLTLFGPRKIRIFKKGLIPIELGSSDDLSFLLK
ncbi:MAG TPA: dipeptidase PepE [Bacteroidales bacterium]|nr:dipeptidase PepE [Bacteroidales bacterium]